jgi:chromosome segregation ATPase
MADTATIAKYTWPEARLAEMKAEYASLTETPLADVNDPRMPLVKDALKQLTTCRSQTESVKDELKKDILKAGREVDYEYRKRITAILDIEGPIRKEKERVEAIAQRAAEAKVKAEEDAKAAEVKRLADEEAARLKKLRDAAEAEQAAMRKKLDDDRAAFELQQREAEETRRKHQAEIDRVAAEERARLAAERKADDERLAAERAKLAEEAANQAAAQRMIDQEREAIDRAKFEAEAKLKAEKDAIAIFFARLERERKETADRAAREAAEKKAEEEARPERQKIQFAGAAIFFARPEGLTTPAAIAFVDQVEKDIAAIRERCQQYGKKPGKKVPA